MGAGVTRNRVLGLLPHVTVTGVEEVDAEAEEVVTTVHPRGPTMEAEVGAVVVGTDQEIANDLDDTK